VHLINEPVPYPVFAIPDRNKPHAIFSALLRWREKNRVRAGEPLRVSEGHSGCENPQELTAPLAVVVFWRLISLPELE
jgi:hypothetical protein